MSAAPYFAALLVILVIVKIAHDLAQSHRLALLQAIWLRRCEIERTYAKISEHPQFSIETYFKIIRAELPSKHEETAAMEVICRQYIEYYYALEISKRDISKLWPSKEVSKFLEYCEEKQGNVNVILHECLIHNDLSKYIFQGPFVEDEILLKKFHQTRRVIQAASKKGQALEKEHA